VEIGRFFVPAPACARRSRDRVGEHAVARRPHPRDDRRVVGIGDRRKDALCCPRMAARFEERTELPAQASSR